MLSRHMRPTDDMRHNSSSWAHAAADLPAGMHAVINLQLDYCRTSPNASCCLFR
jgi:hypothetical protein